MTSRRIEDPQEIHRMALAIGEAGYRDLASDATRLRLAIARRLFREGLDEQLVRLLWAYAQECGDNPARLFAYWLDRPSRTLDKLDEMRGKSDWARRVLRQAEEKQSAEKRSEPAPILEFKRRHG